MKVIHFEIPADSPEKLGDFYAKVFAWKISQWEDQEYWLADTGPKEEKGIGGAIFKKTPEMNYVLNTISVPDIVKAMEKVKAQGGKIIGEVKEIPQIGLNVMASDPEGNLFGMLQPSKEMRDM